MPSLDSRDHRFIEETFRDEIWGLRASGPARSNYRIDVGGHPVRVAPNTHGFTLHIRTEAVLNEGCPCPSAIRHRPGSDLYTLRVFRVSISRMFALLDWLREQPVLPRVSRAAGAGRARHPHDALTRRRFGVEIEFNGISRDHAQRALAQVGLGGWVLKRDGSVRGSGLELVSPPLAGVAGLELIRTALGALRGAGARVDSSCGLHVHHDVRDIGPRGIKRFVVAWTQNQHLIDWLVAPSRRGRQNTYCRAWREDEVLHLVQGSDTFLWSPRRYLAVNIESFPRFGTVEVRQHQGTLEYAKVEAWIKFGQAMIEACSARLPFTDHTKPTGLRDLLYRVPIDEDGASYLLGRAINFGANAEQIFGPPVSATTAVPA